MSGEPHVRIDRGRLAEPRLPKPDERETCGPALGAWGTQTTPSQPPTSPRMRKANLRPVSPGSATKLRAAWVVPAVGFGGQTDDAIMDLDHKEYVVAEEQDGVNGEEVGGEDNSGQLGPLSPRCRRQAAPM